MKRENETSHFQNVTFAVYSSTSQKETKLRTYCFVHITQLIDKNHVIYFDITSQYIVILLCGALKTQMVLPRSVLLYTLSGTQNRCEHGVG